MVYIIGNLSKKERLNQKICHRLYEAVRNEIISDVRNKSEYWGENGMKLMVD